MRTLKKALSLVLVLAMVFALAVPGFAADTTKKASDFKDYSKVTNKEAVDVLTAIGVINGNADGTFAPEGNFTRAEAATLISYLTLGKTVADALPTSATKFSDVPATHWAAKYVQYCADAGIVNGVGNGKFDPDAKLTATQWALMLLGALGYKAANEGISGEGWELATTRLAIKAKVATAEELTGAFNRDMAAKFAFNTLTATVVEYKTNGTNITIGDTTISTGSSAATEVGDKAEASGAGYNASAATPYTQFCEEHFSKLKLTDNENGTHTWDFNGKVGVYADSKNVSKTYTGVVTAGQLYTDGVKKADNVLLVINGKVQGTTAAGGAFTPTNYASSLKVARGSTEKNFESYVGATISLLTNADGKVDTVSVVMPYLAKVDKVYAATATKDAYTKLTVYKDSSTGTTAYVAGNNFAKGDYVLYAPTNDTLVTSTSAAPDEDYAVLELATSFTSTATAYNTTKSTFTANGTTYTYSSAAQVKVAIASLDVKNGTTYTFYNDKNGTIIGAKVATEGTSTLNYVYVSAAQATAKDSNLLNTATDAFKVKVTYLDGKTEVLDYALYTATTNMTGGITKGDTYFVAPNGDKTKLDSTAVSAIAGYKGVYSYKLNADGKITLSSTLTSTGATPTTAELLTAGSVVVNKGAAKVTVAGNDGFATKDTALVLTKNGTVSTYTGYANFPKDTTYTVSTDIKIVVVSTTAGSTKTYSNILVVGGTEAVDTTPDNYVVYAGEGDMTSDGQYYKFFVDGGIKSYLLSDETSVAAVSLAAKTVYGLTTDKDGKAVLTTVADANKTSGEVTAKTDNYIATKPTTGDTVVTYVNGDYSIADISASAAAEWADSNVEIGDTVTVICKADAAGVKNIVAVFVTANVAE